MKDSTVLLQCLRSRREGIQLPEDDATLELLLRQARYANLLSQLANWLSETGIANGLPPRARQQIENALTTASAHRRSARWEVECIYRVLRPAGIDFCLLKGAAYTWMDHSAGRGRLFGDTDILLRKSQLAAGERVLATSGWVPTKIDPYTQNYYRRWMHELPPLHHTRRHTDLDVHHTVVPPIARTGFDIEAFWKDAKEQPDWPGLFVLSPADLILHSAAHLFQEGEFPQGLRDLVDLDALLLDFDAKGGDWLELVSRAQRLDLARHLYYAMSFCVELLNTPVPEHALTASTHATRLSWPRRALMRWLYVTSLMPDHATCKPPGSGLARQMLYLRSHWIKMPLGFLLPHLLRKAFKD